MLSAVDGSLLEHEIEWSKFAALGVVLATKGYPGSYQNGTLIKGKLSYDDGDNIRVFHAGTRLADEGLLANGGRVLNVCAKGETVALAQKLAYQAIDDIDWPQGFWRSDIGWREVARENG